MCCWLTPPQLQKLLLEVADLPGQLDDQAAIPLGAAFAGQESAEKFAHRLTASPAASFLGVWCVAAPPPFGGQIDLPTATGILLHRLLAAHLGCTGLRLRLSPE